LLFLPGRILFAVAIAAFGAEYLFYGRFLAGVPPAPAWTPGAPLSAYALGAVLVLAAVSIAINVKARLSAAVVGIIFLLCVFLLHILKAEDILLHGGARTSAFEALALGCGALMLAAQLPAESPGTAWNLAIDRLALVSRFLFAFSLLVFGVQHYMYADFIATLVPAWLRWHLFWVYLTGTGFIAAGIAIAINVRARLGATLLGGMFLSWVLLLHLPRSIVARTNIDEWTSLFVALGMCGAAWIVASWNWGDDRA
jgi:uncharacterized membrane protein YphA (DoxX/SURF4 family)